MCNLYTLRTSGKIIEDVFDAAFAQPTNAGEGDVYPGGQGLVVREHEGRRVIQQMTWGFPLKQVSKKTGQPIKPKPVNNIANLGAYPWKFIAANPAHRCIIPLSGFCEAEGEWGSKTRTWFTVRNRPIFAWAGMWKDSDEWGAVYSGLMTDCNDTVRPVHNRMPVLLDESDFERWLHGSLEDVIAFQDRCYPADAIILERTADPWFKRKAVLSDVSANP